SCLSCQLCPFFYFFLNHLTSTKFCTLSLHDALPIWQLASLQLVGPVRVDLVDHLEDRVVARDHASLLAVGGEDHVVEIERQRGRDRKSTRLNSSHVKISYAVFCLKKKIKSLTAIAMI